MFFILVIHLPISKVSRISGNVKGIGALTKIERYDPELNGVNYILKDIRWCLMGGIFCLDIILARRMAPLYWEEFSGKGETAFFRCQ